MFSVTIVFNVIIVFNVMTVFNVMIMFTLMIVFNVIYGGSVVMSMMMKMMIPTIIRLTMIKMVEEAMSMVMMMLIRDDIRTKKNVSIRALPELANPPPTPNSGNFTDSFRRRDH